ncbi:BppU family phage baseplate upper protein [Alkalibacterium sp. f15]|uniref:BppU family phage baseplate upper protein n=1 Tax=Alkalibacterium sp. f15 TaxID=3414029 RepID=UPI003BF87E02
MFKEPIFEVFLKSTGTRRKLTIPTVFTNDRRSVKLHFKIMDMQADELVGKSAYVLLYMKDGSFYQTENIQADETLYTYILTSNQGQHSGVAKTQLVVTDNDKEIASEKFEFNVETGLDSVVATEVMIHDWTTLTREAGEFIAEMKTNESQRQTDFDNTQTSRQSTFNANESTRQSTFNTNEQARQTNEDVRVDNEETRGLSESERISNEESRVIEEGTRAQQEQSRMEAEATRSEFYTGFDGKLEATQLQTVKTEKKTTDLEKRVSNVNVNQEATQTVSTNAKIASLPVNTGNGALDATLKGFTATQLIKNGDFSDGLTGWAGYLEVSDVSVTNGILKFISLNISGGVGQYISGNTILNNKYYISAGVRKDSTVISATIQVGLLTAGHGAITNAVPLTTNMSRVSTIITSTLAHERVIIGRIATDGGYIYADDIQLINLTQSFGAGNEPTKEVCDIIFDTYFNGTKSFTPGRVKSVEKNLIDIAKYTRIRSNHGSFSDGKLTLTYPTSGTIASIVDYSGKDNSGGMLLTGNTTYFLTAKGAGQLRAKHLPTNQVWMSLTDKLEFKTTPIGGTYVFEVWGKNQPVTVVSDLQLEHGTTATPYEPYTETLKYIEPVKLNRLPNGVADEITANGDFVQRVGEYTLVASDIYVLEPRTNVDRVRVSNSVLGNLDISGATFNVNEDPFKMLTNRTSPKGYTAFDSVENIWQHWFEPTLFNISFPKGIYVTLASAQANLAGTKIYYQLATPIIHPNVTSGHLISQPKGTVYFEQFQANAGMYANGVAITNTEHPIKALERLSVVDWMTGEERDLDVSKAILTDTAVKHPELVDGDLVFFTYEFLSTGPNGAKTLSFYDSRYTIKDSVTGAFFKWKITVANGVPKIEVGVA